MASSMIAKIISGGQTGVDRAALDVAIELGVPYGGWCPTGGWAEDFPEPPGLVALYPRLRETPDTGTAQRTEWNVRDADACLVLTLREGLEASPGTRFALDLAAGYAKPALVVNIADNDAVTTVKDWLRGLGANSKLGIGGPRESEAPGNYERSAAFLRQVLR